MKPEDYGIGKREILFRAWGVEEKIMYDYPENEDNVNNHFVGDDMIWMQYAGLLDKKGKKIFEGDIVDARAKDEWIGEEVVSVVAIDPYDSGWCVLYPGYKHGLHLEWWKSLEIIGNIFENPEILTTKK